MCFLKELAIVLTAAALSSSSVVKAPVVNQDGSFELLILHNNDMHARFEQTSQFSGICTTADREMGKCYGGFPRVAHVVKEARRAAAAGEGPPVLYLNAGDTYTGTPWFSIYKWQIAAEFINALQPDAVSLGNHEFDNGVSGLTPFIENLTCPVLASNLILNKVPSLEAEPNLRKSVVFNISGTLVGIIGYLTPDTKFLAIKNDVEYIEEVVAIKEEAKNLKKSGIKILIALGHSGFATDLKIAKEVEDIDIVIGGHTNTFLWNGTSPDVEIPEGPYPTLVKQASGRMVPAVQAYAYTKYLGKLHFTFNLLGEITHFDGHPILLDSSIPQDPDVSNIVEKYRTGVMTITELIVGFTSVDLDGQSCRKVECNLGNLITDAIINKYASEYRGEYWTDAPIAVIQGGGIRSSVPRKELPTKVTKGDLLTIMPFDGSLAKVRINGSGIINMLELSVEKYNPSYPPGRFLQFSGLNVVYNFKMPPGKRVVEVKMRCGTCDIPKFLSLNASGEYNILMPAFLAMGGDGYLLFSALPTTALDYNELDSTVEYFQHHSPLFTGVENRITILNANQLKFKTNAATSAKLLQNSIILEILLLLNIIQFL